ncbi:MAG: hypothetical protein ACLFRU_07210, partial [Paracoccaceae bacterium]
MHHTDARFPCPRPCHEKRKNARAWPCAGAIGRKRQSVAASGQRLGRRPGSDIRRAYGGGAHQRISAMIRSSGDLDQL